MQNITPQRVSQKRGCWLSITISLFAIAIRLYYVTHAQVLQPVGLPNIRGDAVEYYNAAWNLLHHGTFSLARPALNPPRGDSFRDPGYPVILALWLRICSSWDSWYAAVILSQAVLGGLTVGLWLYAGRRWMPLPYLFAAGLLMAVWPHSISMTGYLLSETLYGFFIAYGFFALDLAASRQSSSWAVASGAILSIAALTNAVFLPITFVLGFFLFARRHFTAQTTAVFVLAAALVVAPWLLRNATLPASSSSAQRAMTNLVEGSWPSYHEASQAAITQKDANAEAIVAQIANEIGTMEREPRLGLYLMAQRMEKNPLEYVQWYVTKPFLLWDWDIRIGQGDIYVYPTRQSPFLTNKLWRAAEAICQALNPVLFWLMLVGCIIGMIFRSMPATMTATAILLVLVTLVHAALQAEPRYAIPYRDAEILMAMFVITFLSDSVRRYIAFEKQSNAVLIKN